MSLWDILIPSANACTACGLTESFTPKMLVISIAFVLLPASMVGYMIWRLSQERRKK